MCCVCAAFCNHVGNHTYCVSHGGPTYGTALRVVTTTAAVPYFWPFTIEPGTGRHRKTDE